MVYWIMDLNGIQNNYKRTYIIKVLRLLVFSVTVAFLSACVTTGDVNQVKKVARKSCTPVASSEVNTSQAPQIPETQPQQLSQENCLPTGVIEITESFGVDPEIRNEFNQAVTFLGQEKYSEAIKLLKAVTGKTSKFTAPFINLGIAYARTNELEKAEENFKRALDINKQHPVATNELGLIYRKTGRYKEARKLYEDLLAMYPDFLPARKNLGVLCDIYLQDLRCALSEYEEYLKGVPEDPKVKIWVADVKSRM